MRSALGQTRKDKFTVALVGPCAAGKSSLAQGLQAAGVHARQIAQEHSYVANMWQQLTDPDVLIFLDASFETCTKRKQLNWTHEEYAEQHRRLAHARAHCDVYVETDDLSKDQVLARVLEALGDGLLPAREV